jgi:predicted esterase
MPREVLRAAGACTLLAGLAWAWLGCRASERVAARPSPVPAPLTARSAPASARTPPAVSARPDAPWPPRAPPPAASDWCTRELPALDSESCYLLPAAPTHTLLVYLPGIVPPAKTSPQKTRVENIVRTAAEQAGVAALVPRGKQGLAPKGLHDWWGWPTTEHQYRADARALVARILSERRELERASGVSFSRVYLAGSSSGAYFTALLALHGGFAAAGFGILSGGAGARTKELSALPERPVYIGFGSEDSVGGAARRLGEVFRSAGWPVQIAVHRVAHGARRVYLDEAFAFWRMQTPAPDAGPADDSGAPGRNRLRGGGVRTRPRSAETSLR